MNTVWCLTAVLVVDISEGLAAESADNAVTTENIVPEPTARSAVPGVSPGRGY